MTITYEAVVANLSEFPYGNLVAKQKPEKFAEQLWERPYSAVLAYLKQLKQQSKDAPSATSSKKHLESLQSRLKKSPPKADKLTSFYQNLLPSTSQAHELLGEQDLASLKHIVLQLALEKSETKDPDVFPFAQQLLGLRNTRGTHPIQQHLLAYCQAFVDIINDHASRSPQRPGGEQKQAAAKKRLSAKYQPAIEDFAGAVATQFKNALEKGYADVHAALQQTSPDPLFHDVLKHIMERLREPLEKQVADQMTVHQRQAAKLRQETKIPEGKADAGSCGLDTALASQLILQPRDWLTSSIVKKRIKELIKKRNSSATEAAPEAHAERCYETLLTQKQRWQTMCRNDQRYRAHIQELTSTQPDAPTWDFNSKGVKAGITVSPQRQRVFISFMGTDDRKSFRADLNPGGPGSNALLRGFDSFLIVLRDKMAASQQFTSPSSSTLSSPYGRASEWLLSSLKSFRTPLDSNKEQKRDSAIASNNSGSRPHSRVLLQEEIKRAIPPPRPSIVSVKSPRGSVMSMAALPPCTRYTSQAPAWVVH